MKRGVLLLTVLVLLPAGARAATGLEGYTSPSPYRVISTLGTDTPGKGEPAVEFSIEQSGSPDFYRYQTRVATGIWDNLEFGVNIPYHHGDRSSFEDVTFGAKHRVLDERSSNFSGAYLISMSIPMNDDVNSTQGSVGTGVILSKRVGPVMGHFNLLYNKQFDEKLDDQWRSGIGVEFSAARGLKVLAEVYGLKPMGSNEDAYLSEARFAYRFEDEDVLYTTVGVGIGLSKDSSNYRFFASVSMLFKQQGVSYHDGDR